MHTTLTCPSTFYNEHNLNLAKPYIFQTSLLPTLPLILSPFRSPRKLFKHPFSICDEYIMIFYLCFQNSRVHRVQRWEHVSQLYCPGFFMEEREENVQKKMHYAHVLNVHKLSSLDKPQNLLSSNPLCYPTSLLPNFPATTPPPPSRPPHAAAPKWRKTVFFTHTISSTPCYVWPTSPCVCSIFTRRSFRTKTCLVYPVKLKYMFVLP